jgi:hypothetical protein
MRRPAWATLEMGDVDVAEPVRQLQAMLKDGDVVVADDITVIDSPRAACGDTDGVHKRVGRSAGASRITRFSPPRRLECRW